jgi:hypothetical protein
VLYPPLLARLSEVLEQNTLQQPIHILQNHTHTHTHTVSIPLSPLYIYNTHT